MDVIMPTPGTYVVAVSGGIDSRVLLDILHEKAEQESGWKLIVAHLDHGIRPDSSEDRKFVAALAEDYGLPFVFHAAELGPDASEAKARQERYRFLRDVQKDHRAHAIITAHHQDDVIETAVINIVRGSGRKGISALSAQPDLLRPLLNVQKTELKNYAQAKNLTWHEDPTNTDESYLRNYVRHAILPRFNEKERSQLLEIIHSMYGLNQELDGLLTEQLKLQSPSGTIERQWFNALPHNVSKEVLATWLRAAGIRDFDSKTLERLVINAKVADHNKRFAILKGAWLYVDKDHLALRLAER
jgi:tRNA(Ile)-lysidine synthase